MTDLEAAPDRVLSDRYHLGEELGRGGAGRVYRAHDDRLDRAVAVKVLTDLGDSAVTRFRREAATAARIRHPNVVTLHDAGVDGAPYLVMSLVEGPSLAARVAEEGPLSHEDLYRLAQDLFAGLDATHRAGVMHRDLTPRNVLFDADGTALLADFGIARGPDDPTVTAAHTVMGTRPFVAPERLRGEEATPASDVFAVGITLRVAATGSHTDPLPGDHPFAALVQACTDDDPARRPTAAAEVAAYMPSPSPQGTEAATALLETEPLPTNTVTPPVERAPGHDRTHGPRDLDRPVPSDSASSRRPLAVAAMVVTAAVATILAGSVLGDTTPATSDQGATAEQPAPTFDADAPAESARQLATWLREQEG